MKNRKTAPANRSACNKLLKAAALFAVLLLLLASCDKLFIPGDVPDGPSALTLTAEAGDRTAEPLSYYWEKTKTDARTELEGPDPLTAECDPLVVQPGETIRFTFAEDNDPYLMNLWFYESDGGGGYLDRVVLSPLSMEDDSDEEDPFAYSAPNEDGILVAEAIWPSWVNSGISAEVTYAFRIFAAKG